jgi:hypothetical protein
MENQNQEEEQNQEEPEESVHAANGVVISKQKLMALRSLVSNLRQASDSLGDFLSGLGGMDHFMPLQTDTEHSSANIDKVIEGVFDGERMVGADGKTIYCAN